MATLRNEALPAVRAAVTAILILAGLPSACTTGSKPASAPRPGTEGPDVDTYREIKAALDKDGATIDYDTLMDVYRVMVQSSRPIAHTDWLLRQLIDQRNQDPRIDQMVLIFAANIMGSSHHRIPGAQRLFESILEQEERIDQWGMSYIAEAVGDYPFRLPQGDRLADVMESELARITTRERSEQEAFGHHFLPPPKSAFIQGYLNSIAEQGQRQAERARYYILIRNNFSEDQIVSTLRYLKDHGTPDTGDKCLLLMQCMMHYFMRIQK